MSTERTSGELGGDDLIAALEAVDEADPESRHAAAWGILGRGAPSRDAFEVALDLALERGLVPMEFGALIRGRWESTGPAPSWINPVDQSEMIWVAPGPFVVGVERRRATSLGFFLARHPVTMALSRRFLDATGYSPTAARTTPRSPAASRWNGVRRSLLRDGWTTQSSGSPSSTRSTIAAGRACHSRQSGFGRRPREAPMAARFPGAKRFRTAPIPASSGWPRSAPRRHARWAATLVPAPRTDARI